MSIQLRDDSGYQWYEFSTPGNIHYGYVGMAAGFEARILHAGASYAEITDPTHVQVGEARCIESRWCRACYYLNPKWMLTGFFDDPSDYSTIEFGIQLYKEHPAQLTVAQFQSFLTSHRYLLQAAAPAGDAALTWPDPKKYPVGNFDGPDTEKNAPTVSKYLGGSDD